MKQESIGTFLLSATAAKVLREKGTKKACKKENSTFKLSSLLVDS